MPVSTGILALIKDRDATNVVPAKDAMCYKRGYVVQVFPPGTEYVSPPAAPFVLVDITGTTFDEFNAFCAMWRREIEYAVVSQNLATDTHRLNVFVAPALVSVSGLNGLTRSQVESYLTTWNATVVSVAANSVVFDVVVLNAIKSQGFWGRPMPSVTIAETAYNQTTGLHTIRATYSGNAELVALPDATINGWITERGGTVTQHVANTRVTFTITRAAVFAWFQADVKRRVDGVFARRRWTLTSAAVDAIQAAGGVLTITRAQALAYLHNRLDD